MNKLKILLLKTGFLKVHIKSIQKWADRRNLDLIKYAAENGDFRCRKEVAKALAHFDYNSSITLLKNLLHDKVFTVVESTIETLNKHSLPKSVRVEIKEVISFWEKKHEQIKRNWEKPTKLLPGLTIDKSQMKRLSQLKNLLGKQKGSMSIG